MTTKAVTATKKARLLVSALYSDGVSLYQERAFIVDTRVLETPLPEFRCIEIRVIVPARQAEEFSDALRLGEAELYIENIPPRINRK